GNSFLQEKTADSLEQKGKSLVDLVLDGKDDGIFDLSLLKQRELDGLAEVFGSWGKSNKSNLKEVRDEALRNYYADRYDCREGVIDWDYQMQIKTYASIIHPIQFREWRLNGIAFEFGSAPKHVSDNRSLIFPDNSNNFVRPKCTNNLKMDLLTGPFISHGMCIRDRSNPFADGLFEIHNKGTGAEQHRYSATHVALYNITSYMWQASTGRKYEMKQKGDVLSGLGAEDEAESPRPPECEDKNLDAASNKMKISIFPVRDSRKIFNKRCKHFFHSVFISHGASSILQDSNLYEQLKGDATLIVETCRFDLSKTASYKEESIQNIREILSNTNAVETNDMSFGDALLTFKLHP
ncbi:hypothetical protein ACHAXR_005557, partial [Thalassiosira sp. AJA248-18]